MNQRWILIVSIMIFLITSCTTGQNSESTVAHEVIQTQAVQTVVAQLTQDAEATLSAPTFTPEFTATPTETATPSITNTPAPCADSAWVSDITVPDGSILKPGETFTKTWKIKNTGSCNWNTSFYLIFGYGEKMSGMETALPSAVTPGQEIEISMSLTAPNKPGDYFSWWRLKNEWGVPFGEFFGVSITVQ